MWKGTFEEFRWDVATSSTTILHFLHIIVTSVGSSVHISMSGVAAGEAASSSGHQYLSVNGQFPGNLAKLVLKLN